MALFGTLSLRAIPVSVIGAFIVMLASEAVNPSPDRARRSRCEPGEEEARSHSWALRQGLPTKPGEANRPSRRREGSDPQPLSRSLNAVGLAGMAFRVGVVADNGIVMLANIYRNMQAGDPRGRAAPRTRKVWGTVLASTLNTKGPT